MARPRDERDLHIINVGIPREHWIKLRRMEEDGALKSVAEGVRIGVELLLAQYVQQMNREKELDSRPALQRKER